LVAEAREAALKVQEIFGNESADKAIFDLQTEVQGCGSLPGLRRIRERIETMMAAISGAHHQVSAAQSKAYEKNGIQEEWDAIKPICDDVRSVERALGDTFGDVILAISMLEDDV
jgi:hypothetical protein